MKYIGERDPVNSYHEIAHKNLNAKMKIQYDLVGTETKYNIGDHVVIQCKEDLGNLSKARMDMELSLGDGEENKQCNIPNSKT